MKRQKQKQKQKHHHTVWWDLTKATPICHYQSKIKPTTNSTHIWCQHWDFNSATEIPQDSNTKTCLLPKLNNQMFILILHLLSSWIILLLKSLGISFRNYTPLPVVYLQQYQLWPNQEHQQQLSPTQSGYELDK